MLGKFSRLAAVVGVLIGISSAYAQSPDNGSGWTPYNPPGSSGGPGGNFPPPMTQLQINTLAQSALQKTGDASQTTITVPGGVARTQAAMASDAVNVLNILPQTSAATDYTSVINRVLSSGKSAYLPNTGTPYVISGSLTFTAGTGLIGQPGTTIKVTTNASVIRAVAANVTLRDITLNGQSITGGVKPFAVFCTAPNFQWIGGGATFLGRVELSTGCDYALVQNTSETWASDTAIQLDGTVGSSILNNVMDNNGGFGVGANGASNFVISHNRSTIGNAIELVGVNFNNFNGEVSFNTAIGAGDNGISVTGQKIRVIGNRAYKNSGDGIRLYGSYNVAEGNQSIDNGQALNPAAPPVQLWDGTTKAVYKPADAGIAFNGIGAFGASGGAGQFNTVTGNFVDDDQSTITQSCGYSVGVGYQQWAASTVVAAGSFVYSNSGIWLTVAGGTTGTTAPTGSVLNSTFNDGAVTWTLQSITPVATRESASNSFTGNQVNRSTTPICDTTINHNNSFVTSSQNIQTGSGQINQITAGFSRRLSGIVTGTSYTWGTVLANGAEAYRQVTATGQCGPVTVLPTHTSGIVTESDGCSWLALGGSYLSTQQIVINTGNVETNVPFLVPVGESSNTYTPIYSGTGSPLNKVTANVGAVYLRSDGGTSTTFYVKESGTGTTGWVAK